MVVFIYRYLDSRWSLDMTVLRYFLVTFFLVLVFRQNYAVEVAADEVTKHDAEIYS